MATATNDLRKDFANEGKQFVNKAKETATDAMNKVKETATSFGETAGKKAADAACAVGGGIRNFGEKIRETMPNEGYVGEASRRFAGGLEDTGRYLEEEGFSGMACEVGSAIKRYPIPAVLIGIGVGVLIGRSFRS